MKKLEMLQMLSEKVAQCIKCKELAETRTQTVFGDGPSDAPICFLAEAPGKDEDSTGHVLCGQSGKLFNNILKAFNIHREDVYTLNILKCRPPQNRTPTDTEARNCRAFLDLQLRIINPKVIVCLGNVAAQNLLGINTPISCLRGQILEYNRIRVICSYHPSYLLHNPGEKWKVAEDMLLLVETMKDFRTITTSLGTK